MFRTRIIFFGTRGQELTSYHLAKLVENDANLVGFVEAPPGSISTEHTEKDPYEGINEVYHRVWNTSMQLVERLLVDLDNRTLPRKSQDLSKYFYNYEITERDFELDFRQPAEVLYGRASMRPGRFYFIYRDTKYFVKRCSVVKEHVQSRKFSTGIPHTVNGKLVFVTPRKFLQIDELIVEGEQIDPLSIL